MPVPRGSPAVALLWAPARLWHILALGCLAAALSVGLQGYYFGVINNSYHIPIVERWMDDPQFAGDQYIQSLRYHTSYVWPLARVIADRLGTAPTFAVLHAANRVAMFIGLGLLLREAGVRSVAGVLAGVMVFAVTRYLLAASGPGEHDLFMPFLNHSSVTWPFLFASWLFLLQRRLILSFAMQGPVFAVNAFVAICGAPAVLLGALRLWPAERRARWVFCWQVLAGTLLALAIAAPTVAWILGSYTEQAAAEPFSFLGFLRSYYVKHWYITAASPRRLVSFAIVAAAGLACLRLLGGRVRCLVAVWAGYLAVFAAGTAVPYVADSRTLLVLHPMRVGAGCLVMLCVVGIVGYLSRALERPGRPAARYAAAIGLVGLAAGQAGLVVMAACIAVVAVADRRAGASSGEGRAGASSGEGRAGASSGEGRAGASSGEGLRFGAFSLVAAGVLAVGGWRAVSEPPPYDLALLAAARDAGSWIRQNTPPGSMMFVPSGAVDGEDDPVSVWARRPLWYDWKEGAAVMWTPAYHREWSVRRAEAAALRSVDDVVAYACTHGISVIVETIDRVREPETRRRVLPALAYANGAYAVLRPLCPGAAAPAAAGR